MNSKTTLRKACLGFVVTVATTASLAGCAEIEVSSAEPYEPAQVESTGPNQPARVILTEEAEHRVALQTNLVRPSGDDVSRGLPRPRLRQGREALGLHGRGAADLRPRARTR